MKRILVTGAAGFIGTHLCEKLLEEGHLVFGIDNLSMGYKYLKHLEEKKNFTFRYMNVSALEYYLGVLDGYRIDTVFHLAANSDISVSDPRIEFYNTFNTTYNILEYCRTREIKEIVFTSSGSVYGETTGQIPESYGPLLPISHYAAAKLSSEAFISSYAHMYDMKAWILRFPNVVGGHATHGAIFDFVNRIRKNPDILEVLGDGRQSKPYLYIDDLIDAVLFLWENTYGNVNLYNIAGIGETTVREIAESVVKQMRTHTKIIYMGGDRGWKGDVPTYRCDNRKLLDMGWRPEHDSLGSVKKAIKDIIYETET